MSTDRAITTSTLGGALYASRIKLGIKTDLVVGSRKKGSYAGTIHASSKAEIHQ